MIPITIGVLAMLFILWRGWGKPVLTRGEWRMGAGLLAVGLFVGAALVTVRGDWPIGLGLLAAGLAMLLAARSSRGLARTRRPAGSRSSLSLDEARALLGVPANATELDVKAAYTRLMRMAHPDRGGTSGLAAQLNAARDRLLES